MELWHRPNNFNTLTIYVAKKRRQKKIEEKFRKKIQKHFKHTSVWHRSRIFIAEFSDKNEYKIEFVKGCCHFKPSLTSSCIPFFTLLTLEFAFLL